MARQTNRFVKLYRKCLSDYKEEVESKKILLQNLSQADPTIKPGTANSKA
jgi:hypothetical protein